jgi:PAB1-binding protein PBP1
MKAKNQSRNAISDIVFYLAVLGLILMIVINSGCTSAKPSPMPQSYHAGQVRMKFTYVNDTIYYNQYRKIYLVQRKDGRYYPCN